MKTKDILLMFLMYVSAHTAAAYDVCINNICYNLFGMEATVTNDPSYRIHYSGDIVIPEKITHNGITFVVTSIGEKAFFSCSSLTSVVIPNSVTSIGKRAFRDCKDLTSVVIPNSVLTIEEGAFASCWKLATISVSDNVEYIGYEAFDYTPWFNNLPNGMIYLGKVAYKYNGTMPAGTNFSIKEGIKSITGGAFRGVSGLASVTIPSSVTSIGMSAFSGCQDLTSVTIPASVTSMESGAFSKCVNLTSITICDGAKTIGDNAFSGCTALTSIEFPSSVVSLGRRVFEDCSALSSVTISDNMEYIGTDCFKKTAWYNNQPDGMIYVGKIAYKYKGEMPEGTNMVIKDGTLCIAGKAFASCTGLKSVIIPSSVTTIGSGAFSYCHGLTWFIIPHGVTILESSAFYKCSALAYLVIPSSVTQIGGECFKSCGSLKDLYVFIPTPLPIRYDDFSYSYSATLHVPVGCKSKYQAAEYWKNFNEIVEDANPTRISEISTKVATQQQVFTLDGSQISKPRKGLNIINGRKVLVK